MILSRATKRVGRRLKRMAPEAPKNTIGAVIMLAEAVRFSYSQTLGTWGLFDFPRAILRDIRDKDKKTFASECDERSDCVQLNDPEILKVLYELRKLLTRTMLFSKKRFEAFLFAAGFDKADVLWREKTAKILKPAFTVIRDKESKCLFVFIRGTRSIKDTLTDVIGAAVPFKLRRNMVSGYAHRGMLSAAQWIEKDCTYILLNALHQYPDFKIKIVGHSLGGGTAALLTYKLREIKELSSCTCVTFGPAACMTLELAEFGKPFITSIINGYDIVPTLSASSVHDFISKGQIKDKKNILTAVGSRLPFAKAITERIVTRRTKFVMKHGQGTSTSSETSYESVSVEEQLIMDSMPDDEEEDEYNEGSDSDDSDDDENEFMNQVGRLKLEEQDNVPNIIHSTKKEADNDDEEDEDDEYNEEQLIMESMSDDYDDDECNEGSDSDNSDDDEDELMNQVEKLKQEKQDNVPNIIHSKKKEAATSKNITDEESVCSVPTSVNLERHALYPPGKIMHIVHATPSENHNSNRKFPNEKRVYLYETPIQFYGKFRLRRGIILHHLTNSYRKQLGQLINQLEEEHFQYG